MRTAQDVISDLRKVGGKMGLWYFHRIYIEPHMAEELQEPTIIGNGGRHMWNLCSWIDNAMKPGMRAVGAIPRDHMKSTLGTTSNTTRVICYRLKRTIGIVAANDTEAQKKKRNIVDDQLETNKLIIEDFGDAIRPAVDIHGQRIAYNDTESTFANGVYLMCTHMGGKIRGQNWGGARMELIIFDDPEEDESVENPEQRKKYHNWIQKACLNSLERKRGSLLWLGTILHNDSLLNNRIAKMPPETWIKFKLPAYNNTGADIGSWKNNTPLWPEGWTMEALQHKKLECGHATFSQEYMNSPMSDEDMIFRPEWWHFYKRTLLNDRGGVWSMMVPDGSDRRMDLTVFMAVDPAIGQSKWADYFAYHVMGRMDYTDMAAKTPVVRLFTLEMFRAKGLSFNDQIGLIMRAVNKWHVLKCGVEAQGYQASLAQQAWDIGVPVEKITQHTQKEIRVRSSAIHVQQGLLYLPADEPDTARFIEEAESYPRGQNDDEVDSYAMCVQLAIGGAPMRAFAFGKKREMLELISGL